MTSFKLSELQTDDQPVVLRIKNINTPDQPIELTLEHVSPRAAYFLQTAHISYRNGEVNVAMSGLGMFAVHEANFLSSKQMLNALYDDCAHHAYRHKIKHNDEMSDDELIELRRNLIISAATTIEGKRQMENMALITDKFEDRHKMLKSGALPDEALIASVEADIRDVNNLCCLYCSQLMLEEMGTTCKENEAYKAMLAAKNPQMLKLTELAPKITELLALENNLKMDVNENPSPSFSPTL